MAKRLGLNKEESKKHRNDYLKKYREDHYVIKGKVKRPYGVYGKDYFKINKNKIKSASLLRRYGITLDQYNEMFIAQSGSCLICETHQSDLKKSLGVDHCHTTGKIRGLLCDKCNVLLGLANDSIDILNKAIIHLKS